MNRFAFAVLAAACATCAYARTDAYIKLNDKAEKHPRVMSITFPGDADNLDMYNSIYGHGAVIENPWVAYRIYMDNRQSLDLYVKQTPRLELDVTGFYTTLEQIGQGYGCDVLWAGKSIAAGSFRGWRDSMLYTIDEVTARTQTVTSPQTVEVTDSAWRFNGHDIDMTQIYSVNGESDILTVTVRLDGHKPEDLFCTGIQKLESGNSGFIDGQGYAAAFGQNVPDKSRPEMVETVGLGIKVNPENIVKAYEDDLNYVFVVRPDSDGLITYKIVASGSRAKGFAAAPQAWFESVRAKLNPSTQK